MKLQIVTLDFELSATAKKRVYSLLHTGVLLLGATVAYGDVPHGFSDGDVLSAQALNENFADLNARVDIAAPVGTIVAFAGPAVPNGWYPCDGTALKSNKYPALFEAIGTSWGNGTKGRSAGAGTNFNLPDLRGQFLRGVDNGAGRDPEAASRTSDTNGAIGDGVGSLQPAATAAPTNTFATASAGEHAHDYQDNSGWDTCGTPSNTDCGGPESGNRQDTLRTSVSSGAHTHAITGGDSETRPRNAAVNWIIKY